jgi:hypothetical protein
MRLATPRFVRNQDVVSRLIDGELIIVPVRRGVGDMNSLYTLNSVGSVLWEFMAEDHSLPEMVERVCQEFEVSSTQALQDIESFLNLMLQEKLVQPAA